MNDRKLLVSSLLIFLICYVVLILPVFGFGQTYADFYRHQGTYWFTDIGKSGYVVFEGHEDNGNDDTRVYQANKDLVDEKGNVTSVPYNLSTRILGYLPVVLLISLFAATPIKLWKRVVLMLAGFIILHFILMCFLYILIINKFIHTPWLKLYQDLSKTSKASIDYLNSLINHGMGLNNFLVLFIWMILLFIFEKKTISKLLTSKSE